MSSTGLRLTVGALVALVVVAALIRLVDGPGEAPGSGPSATNSSVSSTPAPTTAEPTVAAAAPTAPSASPSTTSAPASQTIPTPSTIPPPTTSVPSTMIDSGGYFYIPKPVAGAQTVPPGGALTKHLATDIAAAFGFGQAEVDAAIARVQLPPEAGGNPEGWLAPGHYPVDEDATATEVVQAMVDRRVEQLELRGIARDQWYRLLTAASVIEKETYNQTEKPKVARVLSNRLDGGGPLQMDSIILYPVPEDRIFTTSEERASDQPYNSYRHDGLPPTPICSPDEESIDAFLAPPAGDWFFYVTIDLDTGETRYAVTYEAHLSNVELLRAWLADNPTD